MRRSERILLVEPDPATGAERDASTSDDPDIVDIRRHLVVAYHRPDGVPVWRCRDLRWYDGKAVCGIYEGRPKICRAFPLTIWADLPVGCSYRLRAEIPPASSLPTCLPPPVPLTAPACDDRPAAPLASFHSFMKLLTFLYRKAIIGVPAALCAGLLDHSSSSHAVGARRLKTMVATAVVSAAPATDLKTLLAPMQIRRWRRWKPSSAPATTTISAAPACPGPGIQQWRQAPAPRAGHPGRAGRAAAGGRVAARRARRRHGDAPYRQPGARRPDR